MHFELPFRTRWRGAVIALLALAVTGCSTLEIAYRMADRLALRYVATYTKLNNRQRGILLPRFEARLADHEKFELPQYVRLFRTAETYASDSLNRQEVDELLDELSHLYSLLIEESIPLAVKTLTLLNDRQLDFLERKLRTDVAKDREKLKEDPSERFLQRRDYVVDDIEEWTGSLDDDQVDLVVSHLQRMADTSGDWHEYRRYRNHQLIRVLRNSNNPRRIARVIHDGWVTRNMAENAMRDRWSANRERYREMLVALDATLSPKQREKMLRRFRRYATNLANLLPDSQRAHRLAQAD